MVSGRVAMLANGCIVPQCADSIKIARGRGSLSASVANSADGIDGSIGSVGAPWEMKTLGSRAIAANLKRDCYQYRLCLRVDKRRQRQRIVSPLLSIRLATHAAPRSGKRRPQ